MGLQKDAIDSRLEGLKLDDHRSSYDDKLRAVRREGKPPAGASPTVVGGDEPIEPIERAILLLEDLTRRIDNLEKKNRNLGDELRHRGREDRMWQKVSLAIGLVVAVMLYLGGHFHWF